MLNIKITSMLSDPNTGFISQVHYEAKGNIGQSSGVVCFTPSQTMTPFAQVTKEMVERWLKDSRAFDPKELDDPSRDEFNTAMPWEAEGV